MLIGEVSDELVATALWVLASPLVSQSDETPLGPSLERFESHLERWNVSSDREVQLDLKDGTTCRSTGGCLRFIESKSKQERALDLGHAPWVQSR